MNSRIRQTGFTLVEVLVAIAIFAVLSATGWIVFDQLIKNRDRNQQHAAHLTQLQYAYAQVLRDLNQAVPIAGIEAGQVYPAFYLENQQLRFNKAGVIDPLQQGLDSLEYVEYRYDTQKQALLRYKQPYIYRKQQQNLQGDILIAPVTEVQFLPHDTGQQVAQEEISEQAKQAHLPQGVEMRFQYQGRDYRWVFSLVQALPEQKKNNAVADDKNNANS